MEEKTITNEPIFRFNVKQSAKGDKYCDYTVRGDSPKEIEERVKEMEVIAKKISTVGEK